MHLIQCVFMCDVRPVKVIRLVGRHSVEEIVLKRAHQKLELTNTVIEGGQVLKCASCLCSCVCVCAVKLSMILCEFISLHTGTVVSQFIFPATWVPTQNLVYIHTFD